MNLSALPPGMFDIIRRIGSKAVTAREMGVEGAVMVSLVNRGFMLADKDGVPAIYTLSEMGLGAFVAMTAPVIPRDCEGMISRIQRTVAGHYCIPIIEMVSQRRARSIARPRQVAMWLARTLTTHSLPTIGYYFGGRDHTTVMHAVKTIDGLCAINHAYADEVYGFLDVLVPETEMAA